jgi:DNA-binding GntR family transcriptional regulator
MRNRDADLAEKLIRQHSILSRKQVLEQMKK